MTHVTAVLERDADEQVAAAARVVATLLGADTSTLHLAEVDQSDRAAAVLEALTAAGTVGAALTARGPHPVCWDVITHVDVPLLVVPEHSERVLGGLARVLLPLDGSVETAAAVSGVARRALQEGASVVAVHVFDASTVPAFWDQPAHTHRHWTGEFLRRNLPEPVELDLRSGRPAEEVLAEADDSGADLVVIAWAQDLGAGRAATVRRALTAGRTPVLLVKT